MNYKKSLKYGINSVILVALALSIVVVLNLLVEKLDFKWDLTPHKIYSISKETNQIIDRIPGEEVVNIYAMFDNTKMSINPYEELLLKYEGAGQGKIKIEFRDPDLNPGFFSGKGEKFKNIAENVVFIIEGEDKVKPLYEDDIFTYEYDESGRQVERLLNIEQAITGAIKYVIAEETPTVYFTEGHNELFMSGEFNAVGKMLEDNNFDINTINLNIVDEIPADCKILIIFSPSRDFTEKEKDLINNYLANGGSAFYFFDGAETDTKFANLQKTLDKYNIEINNNLVSETDESRRLLKDKYSFYADFTDTKLNRELVGNNIPLMVYRARSFKILADEKENLTTTSLLRTESTAESTDMLTKSTQKGLHDIAVGAERIFNQITSKVVVIGDTDYLKDSTLGQLGDVAMINVYSFVSWMNWLHEVEDDIIVYPKKISNKTFKVTSAQARTIFYLSVIVVPIFILLVGLFVFIRRRYL